MKILAKTAVLSMLCLMGMSVNAQNSGSCGTNATWTYDSLTYTLAISGSGKMRYFASPDQQPWNGMDIKVLVIGDSITDISSSAFYNCDSLETVTFAEGSILTSIGYNAFKGCISLASVSLPDSLTSIGSYAFDGCTSLASVAFPDSLTSIGEKSFYGCGLTSVTIPASVTTIMPNAFETCSKLQTVIFEDGISLDSLGGSVFSECSKLTAVTLPNNLTSISSGMFNKCSSLASVTLPDSLISLGYQSFYYCKALKSVTLPSSLKKIGDNCFNLCTALESVTIPASVEKIGNAAFYRCDSLNAVYVNWPDSSSIVQIDDPTFGKSNNEKLTLYILNGDTDANDYRTAGWKDRNKNSGFSKFVQVNVFYVDNAGQTHYYEAKTGGTLPISDAIQSINSSEEVDNVDITYTRTFSSKDVWQAWYMPFDAAYTEMSEKYEVAQILGVFMDAEGDTYITFQPMTSGTVKANTPYVVRPINSGEVSLTISDATLKLTQNNTFTIQSSTHDFTFGGIYEKTVNGENGWYAINTSGNFQALDTDVYLKPMRIWMTVTERSDNPYAVPAPAPSQVMVRVLGDDSTGIGLIESDENGGQEYRLSEKIVIVNGKKYLR